MDCPWTTDLHSGRWIIPEMFQIGNTSDKQKQERQSDGDFETLAAFIQNKYVQSGFKYWWLTPATSRSVCLTLVLLVPMKTMRDYLLSFSLVRCMSMLSCRFCVNKLYSKYYMNDQWSWGDLSRLKTVLWNNHERYFLTWNILENVS